MIIKLMKPRQGIQYDITNAVASFSWSGSAAEAARSFEFSYINAPYDKAIKLPAVETGDFVSLEDDKEGEIFYGQIFGIERSSQTGTITYPAMDMMKNLLKSTTQKNFKNRTAESIAAEVCADAQIPVRELYATGVNISSMICDNMSLYDIIMAGYTKAHRITGEKYFAMIYRRGLAVYKTEWIVAGFTLSDETNIYESDIQESMEEIVNVIRVYDENGRQIGEVKDDESIRLYGVFQKTYREEDGIDAATAAKGMLKTLPVQTIRISAIGDINCLSCYYVMVKDGATGLSGRYWISSDKHIWENGVQKMELTLEFDALMTEVDSEEE